MHAIASHRLSHAERRLMRAPRYRNAAGARRSLPQPRAGTALARQRQFPGHPSSNSRRIASAEPGPRRRPAPRSGDACAINTTTPVPWTCPSNSRRIASAEPGPRRRPAPRSGDACAINMTTPVSWTCPIELAENCQRGTRPAQAAGSAKRRRLRNQHDNASFLDMPHRTRGELPARNQARAGGRLREAETPAQST